MTTTWTAAMDADLMRLRDDGVSSAQIADRISAAHGVTLTRNAILGRAHRLGLAALKTGRRHDQSNARARLCDDYWLSLLNDPSRIRTDYARKRLARIAKADIDASDEQPVDVIRAYPPGIIEADPDNRARAVRDHSGTCPDTTGRAEVHAQ